MYLRKMLRVSHHAGGVFGEIRPATGTRGTGR
jgi:hypothetical protein